MKKIHISKLSIILLLSTIVVSCSKKEEAPKYADLIIGKWYIKEAFVDNGLTYYPQNSCEQKSAFEFSNNGEFSLITYAVSGDFCIPTIVEGTYIMLEEQKKIMVSNGTNSEPLDILKLDTKVMELYVPSSSVNYKLEKAP